MFFFNFVHFDKSTLNGDPNKFYAFPRAAIAANLHNMDFWNSDAISQLKLRAAYGESGNSANFGATFTSLNQVSIGGNGGSTIGGLQGDPNIDPETSAELELGIDARLFDKVNAIKDQVPSLKNIFSFEPINNCDSWDVVLSKGDEKHQSELTERMASVKPEELATLIYTSGTSQIKSSIYTNNHYLFLFL